MIEFRKIHPALRSRHFFTGAVNDRGLLDVTWHGRKLNRPDWTDPEARSLGMCLGGFDGGSDIHVMLNMYWNRLEFEVPTALGRKWFKAVDTAMPPPGDIVDPGKELDVATNVCPVEGRSIVVLISR
jgi:glycogen operon protein